MKTSLVLASASPRRAELLSMLGLDFTVCPAGIEERRAAGEAPPDYVERLAREKALAVSSRHPDALTIGGDTVVVLEDRVLEKPRGVDDARAMLASLAGRAHDVHSGLALVRRAKAVSRVASARVFFRPVGRAFIRRYADTGEPLDKAGAYGIQGLGSALVRRIEGDYYAVMGLSVAAFVELLPALGCVFRPGRGVMRETGGKSGDPGSGGAGSGDQLREDSCGEDSVKENGR